MNFLRFFLTSSSYALKYFILVSATSKMFTWTVGSGIPSMLYNSFATVLVFGYPHFSIFSPNRLSFQVSNLFPEIYNLCFHMVSVNRLVDFFYIDFAFLKKILYQLTDKNMLRVSVTSFYIIKRKYY